MKRIKNPTSNKTNKHRHGGKVALRTGRNGSTVDRIHAYPLGQCPAAAYDTPLKIKMKCGQVEWTKNKASIKPLAEVSE